MLWSELFVELELAQTYVAGVRTKKDAVLSRKNESGSQQTRRR
jgi:hypothetical protein